jgi:ribosomal RNA assembly protein
MEENVFQQEMKIPRERIAVLIGKKGEIKRELEKITKCVLVIDSKEGDILIKGEDPIAMYSLKEIVKAIARGFNPDVALLLLKGDYGFEIVDMDDFARTKNDEVRLKGRVIGAGGKCRRIVEELSECSISVYGKTVGIIGPMSNLPTARRAVEMLLQGSTHPTVYRWLEKQRRIMKMRSF